MLCIFLPYGCTSYDLVYTVICDTGKLKMHIPGYAATLCAYAAMLPAGTRVSGNLMSMHMYSPRVRHGPCTALRLLSATLG